MKYLSIVLLSIFAISCSSSKKEADAGMAKVEEKVEQTKTDAKEAAAPVMEKVDAAVASMSGDFPMITGTARSASTCGTGSNARKVTVIDRADEKDCGVVYEKFGSAKTVAMAKYDMGFCDKVAENIKSNLSGAGLTCAAAE